MQLERLGVKVFCDDGESVDLPEFIPIFHRWIQGKMGEDLLIDVVDYSHVYQGPGILLAAHEGNYSVDESRGRRGLVYLRKQQTGAAVGEALLDTTHKALDACCRLESEPELRGRIHFRADELLIFANDRLVAPNTEQSYEELSPALDGLLDRLFGGEPYTAEREADVRERLSVSVKCRATVEIAMLRSRVAAA